MRLRLLAGAATLPVVLLATACGGEDAPATADDPAPSASSSEAAPEPEPSGLPDCATVWVAGQDLPRPYRGCVEGSGADASVIGPDSVFCSFGRPLVTHDGRFWALPGAEVHEVSGPLERDRDYLAARRSCMA